MHNPSYLSVSRHGLFYFRWPVPRRLHPLCSSSSVKVSLQTRDPKHALVLARFLAQAAEEALAYGARCGMNYNELRGHIASHFSRLLAARQAEIGRFGRLSEQALALLAHTASKAEATRISGEPLYDGDETDTKLVAAFIRQHNLSILPGTPDHQTLRTEFKGATRDYCNEVIAADRSMDSFDFSKIPRPEPTGLSLQSLIDAYCSEKKISNAWVQKTVLEKEAHFELLKEILDQKLDDISRLNVLDAKLVKDTLMRYPKNRNKIFATRGLTLSEVLLVRPVEIIKRPTINKHLQTYGDLFRWAKLNGHMNLALLDKVSIQKDRRASDTERTAFSHEQVGLILKEVLNNEHGLIQKPFHTWGPLIGLYTGARLNEISQLRLDDIIEIDGIWCIRINDGEGQQLKTRAAKRSIPIHRALIAHGLLDHADAHCV
jgi:hypothetical protein